MDISLFTWPNWLGLQNIPTATLQRGKTISECPGYDTKEYEGEALGNVFQSGST